MQDHLDFVGSSDIGFPIVTEPPIIVERKSTYEIFPLPVVPLKGIQSEEQDIPNASSNLTFSNMNDNIRDDQSEMECDETVHPDEE